MGKITSEIAISIIIPCYNNGTYLREMIECFLNQTEANWELIIVDDGSTDNTPEIVKHYAEVDRRISFFQRNRLPKGSVVCRNIGFQKSKGKYICHLDADDLVSETFVEHRVEFMENNPDLDYATFRAIKFVDGTPVSSFKSTDASFGKCINTNDILEDFLTANYSFSVWNNIYRRNSIKQFMWDENVKIYTDFSYIVPIILAGLKHSFSNFPNADYYYRLFPTKKSSINMCSNFISDEKCKSTLYLFEKTLTQIDKCEDAEKRKEQFCQFIIHNYIRLLKGRDENQIKNYIKLVNKYFPEKISSKFISIYKNCKNVNNENLFEFRLYLLITVKFKTMRYRDFLIHSLAKYLLRKQ